MSDPATAASLIERLALPLSLLWQAPDREAPHSLRVGGETNPDPVGLPMLGIDWLLGADDAELASSVIEVPVEVILRGRDRWRAELLAQPAEARAPLYNSEIAVVTDVSLEGGIPALGLRRSNYMAVLFMRLGVPHWGPWRALPPLSILPPLGTTTTLVTVDRQAVTTRRSQEVAAYRGMRSGAAGGAVEYGEDRSPGDMLAGRACSELAEEIGVDGVDPGTMRLRALVVARDPVEVLALQEATTALTAAEVLARRGSCAWEVESVEAVPEAEIRATLLRQAPEWEPFGLLATLLLPGAGARRY